MPHKTKFLHLSQAALIVTAVLLAPPAASGQPVSPLPDPPPVDEFDEGAISGFSIVLDNDVIPHFGPGNEDRNYTGALGLRLGGNWVKRFGLTKPLQGLDWLTRMSTVHVPGARTYHSTLLFGTGFTPDELRNPNVEPADRPYGSILGLSIRRMTVDDASLDRAWASELAIGALGLDVSKNVQTSLHRSLRKRSGKETPYDPKGWHNQISNGGEFTVLYRVGYEQRLLGNESGPGRKHWQAVGGLEGSAGYYTNASAALSARVGAFTSDFWEYSSGGMNLGVGQQKAGRSDTPKWDAFLFGGLRPRLVIYNAPLQGQWRDSVHTVDPRRLVLEWEGGAVLSVPLGTFQLAAVYQFAQGRTAEFETPTPRAHGWGSWVLMLSRPGGKR